MPNTIRIKKRSSSGAAGQPGNLAPSELAFNENTGDLKLYYGYGDNGDGTASTIITVGGSGAFFSKTDTKGANNILAGPTSGSAANPTFRSLVAADIPSLAHTKISDFDTGVQANRLDQMAAATAVVSGVTPTADAHFATKGYVDSVSEGLDVKDSVRTATTEDVTMYSVYTLNGLMLAAEDRVLVKDQDTASENGIYIVKNGSTWVRADDMAAGSDAAGSFTFVEGGTTAADTGWVCSSDKGSAVVGTNSLSFTQFSGSGSSAITAGNGLVKNSNTLSVDIESGAGLEITNGNLDTKADLTTLSACQSGGAAALAALTSTEIAILDGATVTTSELNILDGVTSTAAELNILDGVTSTAAELNLLDGVTATTAELNYVDGVTSNIQTQLDSKAASGSFQASDAELTELATMSSGTASALADLTGTEVGILDGATVTTDELNILDGVTSTASELNILDGVTSTTAELNILDGVTATAAELNYVDGVTSNVQTQLDAKQAADADLTSLSNCQSGGAAALAALTSTEIGILDGATVTTSELNILDGVTSTASELNILDGVTATATELNYVDGVTSAIQTQLDAKQASDADLTSLSNCQSGGAAALAALTSTEIGILDGATVSTSELNILDGVTSTASELNILDGVTSTTAELNILDGVTATASELNILDGVTATASELNILDGVTSTASELNVLDGITSTTTELNLMDGGTSATSTTLASADRFVCNDAGTMKQVALSDLVTYLEDGATSGFVVDGGTY